MNRSGTPAAPRGQTQKTSIPQSGNVAGVPDKFTAWGLRKVPEGYELVEVTVDGPLAHVRAMRQAEPQPAIASAYLEAAVANAYLESDR